MADNFLPEEAVWEEGIRQVETTDTVLGGPGGTPNIAPKQLANRTLYLKQKIENTPSSMLGLIGEFHNANAHPGWLDLKGGELSRVTDKLLWDYAVTAGMVITQATKDADPMTHAMKFGDGDGETTFTLPNHHLGHFVRGNPSGVQHGETQGDAIRNIEGHIGGTGSYTYLHSYEAHSDEIRDQYITGAFSAQHAHSSDVDGGNGAGNNGSISVEFNASNVVPTADENRPYTANLSIKIHRGWM